MLYIFGRWSDDGENRIIFAVANVQPIEGEDGEADFTIYEENSGDLLRLLESDMFMLGARDVTSEDGMFDKHRLDHWAALPKVIHGSRLWVEALTDEEAAEYAKELGGFEEGESEKGV